METKDNIEKPEAVHARDFVDGLPYIGEYFQPDDSVYLKKPMDKYIESLRLKIRDKGE